MSLPERTPWEMVQEFFNKFNGKTGNYIKIEMEIGQVSPEKVIKLKKDFDGSVIIYDPSLENDILFGRYKPDSRILIKGELEDRHDSVHLKLRSESGVILSKRRYGGDPYYKFELEYHKEGGHEIHALISEPGLASTRYTVYKINYEEQSEIHLDGVQQTAQKITVQIDVDKPWDLMIGYLKSSLKGNDIYLEEVNRVIFYLKNDSNKYLEENSIQILTMERGNDSNISIVYVSNKLNGMFNELKFKGVTIKKENLLVGEEGERKELQIYGVKEDDYMNVIYIDEYPRGKRGHTMRLGFAMKFEGNGYILRTSSYKIIGMEVY